MLFIFVFYAYARITVPLEVVDLKNVQHNIVSSIEGDRRNFGDIFRILTPQRRNVLSRELI